MNNIESIVRSGQKLSSLVSRFICEHCNFINSIIDNNCRNCRISYVNKTKLIHSPFPSYIAIDHIEYFLNKAYDRQDDARNNIVAKIIEITGKSNFDINQIIATIKNIQNILLENSAFDYQSELKEALSCNDEQLKILHNPLLDYNDTHFEECTSVLVLTITLLEIQFNDHIKFLAKANNKPDIVQKKNSDMHYNENKKDFKKVTNKNFEKEVKIIDKNFLKKCKNLNKLRNEVIHEYPVPLDIKNAELACEMALKSYNVFSQLHNKFCIKKFE